MGFVENVNNAVTNIDNIIAVNDNEENINLVATDIDNVNVVATDIDNVNTTATNIDDINDVATDLAKGLGTNQPTDSSILNALTNATDAQLKAWEAEAEAMTAESYAIEAEDVEVNVWTSDGDGNFTDTPQTGVYSSLHSAIKSAASSLGAAENIATDVSEFDGILNSDDDDVQKSLNKLDEITKGISFTGQVGFSKGADVASASVLPILSDGNYFDVTGATTISAIGTTNKVGTVVKLHFDASLTLTNSANLLILPSGADIITQAGDEAEFVEYVGTYFRCTSYTRASGEALIAAGGTELLAEHEVTGSSVTSVDFSGLDITAHNSYRIEIDAVNPQASAADYYLFINGDTTTTNYYSQLMSANGTTFAGARTNFPACMIPLASGTATTTIFLSMDGSGYPRAISNCSSYSPSAIRGLFYSIAKTATVTNITQITITASVASAIGVGSKLRIYRGDV